MAIKEIHIEYFNDGYTGDLLLPIPPAEATRVTIDWPDRALIIKEAPVSLVWVTDEK